MTMNRVEAYLATVALLVAFPAYALGSSFAGAWSYAEKDDNNITRETLTLSLIDRNGDLAGTYCFISNYGRKIDCPDAGDINVRGVVDSPGVARLIINPDDPEYRFSARIVIDERRIDFAPLMLPEKTEFFGPGHVKLGPVDK